MDISNKVMEITIWHYFLLMKAETGWKYMKSYGAKLTILSLDQQIITQMIMMKNVRKSNSVQVMICLWKKKKLFDIIIVATSVFNDGNKYYPQVFVDDCFYKLMVKI